MTNLEKIKRRILGCGWMGHRYDVTGERCTKYNLCPKCIKQLKALKAEIEVKLKFYTEQAMYNIQNLRRDREFVEREGDIIEDCQEALKELNKMNKLKRYINENPTTDDSKIIAISKAIQAESAAMVRDFDKLNKYIKETDKALQEGLRRLLK